MALPRGEYVHDRNLTRDHEGKPVEVNRVGTPDGVQIENDPEKDEAVDAGAKPAARDSWDPREGCAGEGAGATSINRR